MDVNSTAHATLLVRRPICDACLAYEAPGYGADAAHALEIQAHDFVLSQLRGHHGHTLRGKGVSRSRAARGGELSPADG